MNNLGIDVHSKTSVWCLLDHTGDQMATGKVATTVPELQALMRRLGGDGELQAGQEIGTMAYLVHDAITRAGVRLLSFNAQQLRMIAASRKKTDRRDAYWIAKALQTGMMPHPVYLPTGKIRELRELLSRRQVVKRDLNRWRYRARCRLRAAGHQFRTGGIHVKTKLDQLIESPDGVETDLLDALGLYERQIVALGEELAHIEAKLVVQTKDEDVVRRLQTIPGVGEIMSATIYAWVGDVTRFPNAKALAAYAGLVPSVWQSGDSARMGGITKLGSKPLRAGLVQCAHVATNRCRQADAAPLKAIYERIRGTRGRRKVAIVGLARHILRIAFHIMRDGTEYNPARLKGSAATP